MNAIGTSRVADTPHSPNISCDPPNSARSNAIASPARGHVQAFDRPYAQAKISGAVTITPSQSRSHHCMKSYGSTSIVLAPNEE